MFHRKPLLMGSELEIAVSGIYQGRTITPMDVADFICSAARSELIHLADMENPSGIYLENGGRFYCDINGHPEYASPECFSPEQVAAYDKAAERTLARLARKVQTTHPGLEVRVTKNNLSPVRPDSCTFGNHESYTSWVRMKKAVPALLPHLVTRLPYAGSGCLSHHSAGVGFELSQRARHLVLPVGNETTGDRAIFCTRVRRMSDRSETGWIRVHLIGKDSQRAPLGVYLTFGVTGLLFWILNHGGRVGQGLELAEPVDALRRVSLDPTAKTPLALTDGRRMTAVEIQQAYLREVELFAQFGELPEWGPAVIGHWRRVLELLSGDSSTGLIGLLDPYTKLHLYGSALDRAGYTWNDLQQTLGMLEQLRARFSDVVVWAVIAEDSARVPHDQHEKLAQAQSLVRGAGQGGLDRLRFALKLQVLDQKYHEIEGLYDDLARAGQVESVVLNDSEIDQAMTTAPAGGRAALRASFVRAHHGQVGWTASWRFVARQGSSEGFDLTDPFSSEAKPLPATDSPIPQRSRIETLHDLMRRLRA